MTEPGSLAKASTLIRTPSMVLQGREKDETIVLMVVELDGPLDSVLM